MKNSSWCSPIVDESLASCGEAVFLEAALWLSGNRVFDETCGEGRAEVVGAESGTVGELELFHAFQGGQRFPAEHRQEGGDLIGDLVADLIGSGGFTKSGEEGLKQEFDEGRGVPSLVASGEDLVVIGLLIANDCFHRKLGEKRIPAAENEGLPKAAEAAVAVGEWMHEFEFVMEHTTGHERMGIGALEPT